MNFKKFSIKFKLIIVGFIFIIGMSISFFGVIEILKVTKLKSLVKEHMEYMVNFINRGEKLIDLIEQKEFKKATNLINKDTFAMEDMGNLKLIRSIKNVTITARDSVNIFEEYLFRVLGFGKAFDLIYEDIENCKKLELIFITIQTKEYKNIDSQISFLNKYVDEVEDKEDEFELIIMLASKFVQKLILILLSSISLVSIIFLFYISKSILYSIKNFQNGLIDFFSYLNHEKEDLKAIKIYSNDEFKEMSEVINRHIESTTKALLENISIVEKVANGDYSVKMKVRGSSDRFAKSMNIMINKLKRNKEESDEQNWLKDGVNSLNKRVSGNLNIKDVTNGAISFLCEYLDGLMGVIYIKRGEILELNGKYAFLQKRGLYDKYRIREGIIGQVANQKSPIILNNVTESNLNSYTYPLIYEDRLYGVLEIIKSSEFDRLHLEFLNLSTQIIATYLFVAMQNEKIDELAKKI